MARKHCSKCSKLGHNKRTCKKKGKADGKAKGKAKGKGKKKKAKKAKPKHYLPDRKVFEAAMRQMQRFPTMATLKAMKKYKRLSRGKRSAFTRAQRKALGYYK